MGRSQPAATVALAPRASALIVTFFVPSTPGGLHCPASVIEHLERPLTPSERDEVTQRLTDLRVLRTSAARKGAVASAIGCTLLAAATLAVSDAPRSVILLFWLVLAVVFAVWTTRSIRVETAPQEAALAAALQHDRARVTRIQAARVAELEEIEDEGACYAFDVGDGKIVLLTGQQYYPTDTFPNSDVSIVDVMMADGRVADVLIRSEGVPLQPVRRIDAAAKALMELPEDLAVVRGDLDEIEHLLTPSARVNPR